MLNKIKLRNPKSVSFGVRSFCVPLKRKSQLKHVIHAARNVGFTARPKGLQGSAHGVARLTMLARIGYDDFAMRTLGTIDGSRIKRVFCYVTSQAVNATSALISVTDNGGYYTTLTGSLITDPLPNAFRDADSFEKGFFQGKYYIFAINQNGLFAADNGLSFLKVQIAGSPKSMKAFDTRLFVLDSDSRTIHFSAPSDMLDFGAETGLSGCVKADDSFGEIIELGEFEGKLLIVHKSGFSTLEPSYDPQKFVIKSLATCHEEIIPNTVQSLGSAIYFLTKEGLCALVNGKVTLLDVNGDFARVQPLAASIIYDNRYYLAYRNSSAGEGNNQLLVVEKFFDSYTIIKDICIRAFERIFNKEACRLGILTNELANVYQLDDSAGAETPLESRWESDWFALTYAATVQYIKQVLIKTTAPIILIVANNRGEQRLRINGSPDVQKINLNMKGEMFKISIESNTRNANISDLTVVVGFNTGNG